MHLYSLYMVVHRNASPSVLSLSYARHSCVSVRYAIARACASAVRSDTCEPRRDQRCTCKDVSGKSGGKRGVARACSAFTFTSTRAETLNRFYSGDTTSVEGSSSTSNDHGDISPIGEIDRGWRGEKVKWKGAFRERVLAAEWKRMLPSYRGARYR